MVEYRDIEMPKRRAQNRAGMVVTTVALPPDLHRRLAVAALEENAASAELIRQAAQEWLDKRDRQRKGRAKRCKPEGLDACTARGTGQRITSKSTGPGRRPKKQAR